jgi:hypothetical protein
LFGCKSLQDTIKARFHGFGKEAIKLGKVGVFKERTAPVYPSGLFEKKLFLVSMRARALHLVKLGREETIC